MLPVQSVYADFCEVENLWPDYKEEILIKQSGGMTNKM